MEKNGNLYQKITNTLFALLVAAIGIVWNNSQRQIERSLSQIEELMKLINSMQVSMASMNYRIDMLQYRLNIIDSKLDIPAAEKANEFPSTPKFR